MVFSIKNETQTYMKIIIVGKGGSGKDYLKKKIVSRGAKESISYTTRPPRKGERDGFDYNFVDEPTFKEMIDRGEFREWAFFEDKSWYYGTTLRDFSNSNIFIMTPSGVRSLSKDERNRATVIYLDIDEDTRRQRLIERKDADEVDRRITRDTEDFEDFIDYDIRITNPEF